MTSFSLPDFKIPVSLEREDMPDLLRYWYLGPKARRHMMTRRFREVDAELGGAPGARLLDIGSAWGYNVMALNRLGYRVTGMDLITDQFGAGQAIAGENGVEFPVIGADAARLPFAGETFDFITMVETLEHVFLEDRPAVLTECYRVLKERGRLVLSTPNYYSIVERFKRRAARSRWLQKKLPTMCYPDEGTSREDYHPYQYHSPLPSGSIHELLIGAGFRRTKTKTFLFTLKNTLDPLFPLTLAGEWVLEKLPIIKNLAATTCFVAEKLK